MLANCLANIIQPLRNGQILRIDNFRQALLARLPPKYGRVNTLSQREQFIANVSVFSILLGELTTLPRECKLIAQHTFVNTGQ